MPPANLVASPNPMTSKPLARGSSVPVWPARFAPRRRFALCSTAFELGPTGLSISSTPLTGSCNVASMWALVGFLSGDRGVYQLRQPHAALDRSVVMEPQLRGDAQLQAPGELRAQESCRAREPRFGLGEGFGVAERGEKHP